MIKKPFPVNKRPTARFDRPRPATLPGWYKRFRQLAATAGISMKVK